MARKRNRLSREARRYQWRLVLVSSPLLLFSFFLGLWAARGPDSNVLALVAAAFLYGLCLGGIAIGPVVFDELNNRWLRLLGEQSETAEIADSPEERQALLDRIEVAAESYPHALAILGTAVVPLLVALIGAAAAVAVAVFG